MSWDWDQDFRFAELGAARPGLSLGAVYDGWNRVLSSAPPDRRDEPQTRATSVARIDTGAIYDRWNAALGGQEVIE